MRFALLTAVAVLAAPATAAASHVAGETYTGTVTTGQGGTVTLDVSAGGDTVDVGFSGLGHPNPMNMCSGVGFNTGEIPITNHSFNYVSPNGQISASGSFGPSSAGGIAQVLTDPCTTGSQSWFVAGPDLALGTRTPGTFLGMGILNTTGADQTQQRSAKRGRSGDFDLAVVNQGTESASFFVEGCKSSNGFKVTWSDETGNVTDAVAEGSYETRSLAPTNVGNDEHELALKIKALNTAAVGKTKTCKVTAKSDLLVDVIKAKLKVKPG